MCTTKHGNKHWCPGLHMDMDIIQGGGCSGGETITWDSGHGMAALGMGNFYYLMFVHDYSNHYYHSLTKSGVRVVLYGNLTGQAARYTCPKVDPNTRSRFGFFMPFLNY